MFQAILTFLAAISQAGSATTDKFILSREKVSFKLYLVVSFFLISLFTLPLFILFGEIKPEASQPFYLLLLFIGIIMSAVINILFYSGLKHIKITEIEPIIMLAPLMTVFFASIFFKDERNYFIIALAVIACLSLIWAHFKKEHLKFSKWVVPILIYSIFISPFGAIISKKLLTVYNPFAYGFIHTLLAFIVFLLILKPNYKQLNKENGKYFLLTNILTTIAWIIVYFSYINIGIVRTTLIMILYPVLVYVFARIFLKEKIYWKNIVALVVILICATLAQIYPYLIK